MNFISFFIKKQQEPDLSQDSSYYTPTKSIKSSPNYDSSYDSNSSSASNLIGQSSDHSTVKGLTSSLEIYSHRKVGKHRYEFKVFNTNKMSTRWITTDKLEQNANVMKVSIPKKNPEQNPTSNLTQDSQDKSESESESRINDEEIAVVEIMKHKKLKNNNLMFELKFSDGTTDWSDSNCTKIDCEGLLIKYMTKHKLEIQKSTRSVKKVKSKTGVKRK